MFQHLKNIITISKKPDQAILDLLVNTTIGTNGAKYQHLHTAKKIHTLHKPNYITIRRNNKAFGNMTVCERPLFVKEKEIDSLYVRYFSFASLFQSKGKRIKKDRQSIFEKYLQALFTTSNMDVQSPEYKPSVYWAFIDPENNKSWNMADRFGFETIGYFSTYVFSRFFPKLNTNVSAIKSSEIESTWKELKHFYKDYSNLSRTHLFEDDNYFVYRVNGEIVAGIQVFDIHWRIDALPGKKGKLLVNTLPYIPFLKRIINPKSYKFLATEGLFWKGGHESVVDKLLEAVLAEKKRHSFLMWFDDGDDKLINQFNSMNVGIMQKMKADNSIEILAKFNNFDPKIKADMVSSKKYISGFDTT
jgi:hypothetical protein